MIFNRHSELEGKHAFLSPSKYHWINYTDEKFEEVCKKYNAKEKGTRLHEFASNAISLGIRLENTSTIGAYVNDCIDYGMIPEQPLYYSRAAFGTADAISFDEETQFLRIHDFKSGVTPVSMRQLEIYAALFCLEYGFDPRYINIELRIYQLSNVLVHNPEAETIQFIMDKIVDFDRKAYELNIGVEV